MNTKDIIQLNNEKRKQLSEENLVMYEEMLVYVRLNSHTSELETEEILYELLEHLLEAQKEGKTAKDVFGDDLKAFCDELIQEIPNEKKKKNLTFWTYLSLDLFAIVTLTFGIISFLLHFIFGFGTGEITISFGKGIVALFINIAIIYLATIVILKWLRKGSFQTKGTKKWVEFLQLWIICTFFIALMYFATKSIPNFGANITIHHLAIVIIGLLAYMIKFLLNKRYRFVS